MRVQAAWAAACVALCAFAVAENVQARDQYGTIAYSASSDSVYFRIECDTQEECEADALKTCRDAVSEPDTCEILLSFHNTCGAFARASNGSYGTGWGTDQSLARSYAVKICKKYGGKDCVAKSSACSNGSYTISP